MTTAELQAFQVSAKRKLAAVRQIKLILLMKRKREPVSLLDAGRLRVWLWFQPAELNPVL